MDSYKIAILDGDGIGPEIMYEAIKILDLVAERNQVNFELLHAPFGASAYFSHGHSFPKESKDICDQADAILKGPIGLSHEEIRELVGGLYFGNKETGINEDGKRFVNESLEYDEDQIKRIAKVAFDTAQKRKKVLHNIHKSNVLKSSVLWNEVIEEVAADYPDVEIIHILVDAAATYLCLNPGQFDVMVMENMFGDILSDQGGGILGSLGLMPSACIGPKKAYYEPSHGSAPDIAGQSIANPYSMIGSVAMMLEMSFNMEDEAKNVWHAMQSVFAQGYSTPDLSKPGADAKMISTDGFGDLVAEELVKQ